MEKKWKEMSAGQRRDKRFETWAAAEGVEFESAEAAASYRAAVVRYRDVLERKKEPDRVPLVLLGTFLGSELYGVSPYEAMYEPEKLVSAHLRLLADYRPDYYVTPVLIGYGKVFELLGYKQYKWPGHGVSPNSVYQYVEGEYMMADEYPALIDDPTDFWLRTYMPRAFGALEPLKTIAPFTDMWEMVLVSTQMIPFGIPPVQDALKALMEAGNAAMSWIRTMAGFDAGAKAMGVPGCFGGATKAPFDLVADTLRGTRAVMIDMYRQPDMVLKAVERLTPLAIKQGVSGATAHGVPSVFMPLHKGADGFMSDAQFARFYWPSLKAVILGLAEEGCVPFLFCEGSYNSRLEYLKELPEGSCVWIFDRTDMPSVKEAIGARLCIGGNVPSGLILTGTPEKVRAYCTELIDVAGKGGGYIMSFGTSMDEGRPDTIRAMVEATREHGVYR